MTSPSLDGPTKHFHAIQTECMRSRVSCKKSRAWCLYLDLLLKLVAQFSVAVQLLFSGRSLTFDLLQQLWQRLTSLTWHLRTDTITKNKIITWLSGAIQSHKGCDLIKEIYVLRVSEWRDALFINCVFRQNKSSTV